MKKSGYKGERELIEEVIKTGKYKEILVSENFKVYQER